VQKITIAIDGFSSCGKSTLAKALAQKLGYKYIDTGAMYRAVTWFALEKNLIDDEGNMDAEAIVNALPEIEIRFAVNPETYNSDVYLNEVDIEHHIRKMQVSRLVSKVSAIREVREKMVALQRQMGKGKGVVLDGRDIGTHVFPKAELKLFMTADNEVRARRRMDEYSSKGQFFSLDEVLQSLKERDDDDLNRKESPLIKADDAVVLDNSELNKEEQLEFVLKLIYDLQFITKDEQAHLPK
jgi:cytidylate kinase